MAGTDKVGLHFTELDAFVFGISLEKVNAAVEVKDGQLCCFIPDLKAFAGRWVMPSAEVRDQLDKFASAIISYNPPDVLYFDTRQKAISAWRDLARPRAAGDMRAHRRN